MEICVDCLESAINGVRGGVKRIELCSALSEGGLTPSVGLLKVLKSNIVVPVFCMIRPRGGDFLYSELELQAMEEDIKALLGEGANGLVFGCLTSTGEVDVESCNRLISVARKINPEIDLTFHRAIDHTRDIMVAVEKIKSLGFSRILTSGGESSAITGKDVIRDLIEEHGDSKFIIFPGGGINADNLDELLTHTNCFEFHASARTSVESKMEYKNEDCSLGTSSSEYSRLVSTIPSVSPLTKIYKDVKMLKIIGGSPQHT